MLRQQPAAPTGQGVLDHATAEQLQPLGTEPVDDHGGLGRRLRHGVQPAALDQRERGALPQHGGHGPGRGGAQPGGGPRDRRPGGGQLGERPLLVQRPGARRPVRPLARAPVRLLVLVRADAVRQEGGEHPAGGHQRGLGLLLDQQPAVQRGRRPGHGRGRLGERGRAALERPPRQRRRQVRHAASLLAARWAASARIFSAASNAWPRQLRCSLSPQ